MGGSRIPRFSPAFFTCVGFLGLAGCGLLTGLDTLQEVECVGVCIDGGGAADGDSGSPASDDASADSDASNASLDGPSQTTDATEAAAVGDDSTADGGGSSDGPGSTDSTDAPQAVDARDSAMGPDTGGTLDASDASRDTGPPPVPCGSHSLPLKGATCSSVHPAGAGTLLVDGPAPLAIDGNFSTRWESDWAIDPSWIVVDFGAPVFVSEVDILWQACATNYTIQLSNDQTRWSTIATQIGRTQMQVPPTDWTSAVVSKNLSGVGRYLRIYGTARCASPMYGYSIWEMRVYGDPNASCQP
jgi:hypothetical protein